jgi:RNA polymerase sigma-70 factor, ECF subfamily
VSTSEPLPAPAAPSTNDGQVGRLLREAIDGGPQAVGRLLETCRRYLLLVADREVGSEIRQKVAASDLVQETLADAWQAFDRFSGRSEAELLAWLRRILLNNVASAANKHRNTAKRNVSREVSLDDSRWATSLGGQFPAPDASPSACAATGEERQRLFDALDRLPSHYEQVIRLRNFEYLPFAEIADEMHLSADAARKLWERAVQHLANALRPSDVAS